MAKAALLECAYMIVHHFHCCRKYQQVVSGFILRVLYCNRICLRVKNSIHFSDVDAGEQSTRYDGAAARADRSTKTGRQAAPSTAASQLSGEQMWS